MDSRSPESIAAFMRSAAEIFRGLPADVVDMAGEKIAESLPVGVAEMAVGIIKSAKNEQGLIDPDRITAASVETYIMGGLRAEVNRRVFERVMSIRADGEHD